MPMNTAWPVRLEQGRIGLRPLSRRDERAWSETRARNAAWLGPWDATTPIPGEGPRNYAAMWRLMNRQAKAGAGLPFAIEWAETVRSVPRFAGQLSVSSITYGAFRSCTMGYWVDASLAGRGIMPVAVAMASDYCFRELRLHRVEINIRPENAPSLRVVEKLGFRDEGVRERYLHIDGDWRDHRSFALFAEDCPGGVLEPLLERMGPEAAAPFRA
ncbi:GNAT family protein [Falsarthrobacter nasiphocae]|uniref:Ribosomal-protein-alanine N-acetyltransferase n=1 Tax=Falsarthrobacter nasiphocae TaxID=189863 RepID=A0AAE3YI44_9MICC|nr:GNAT family protein [Falsarthrobacter nasiphocae]MDR6892579.1 ribosomal-protein-alanine N-acetyltransferase [Falsarthrobacter nasiphocae]